MSPLRPPSRNTALPSSVWSHFVKKRPSFNIASEAGPSNPAVPPAVMPSSYGPHLGLDRAVRHWAGAGRAEYATGRLRRGSGEALQLHTCTFEGRADRGGGGDGARSVAVDAQRVRFDPEYGAVHGLDFAFRRKAHGAFGDLADVVQLGAVLRTWHQG